MARPTLPASYSASPSGHLAAHNLALDAIRETWDEIDALPSGGGSGSRSDLIVASVDAPTTVRDAADYVCDGTADDVQINAAIALAAPLQSRNANSSATAAQRGRVQLTGGRFTLANSILMDTGVTLQGAGWLTELRDGGITAATGNGSAVGVIKLASSDVHLTCVRDLYIYGNYASGGSACSGIAYDQTGSTSGQMDTYPSSSPDADHIIKDLFIDGFTGGSSRHGIRIQQSSTTNLRGTMISGCQIRNIGGNGIWMSATPDGHISECHVGTVTGSGYLIDSSNMKITNCKSFYCDSWGFEITGNRSVITCIESQDDVNGVKLAGTFLNLSGATIDTSDLIGLQIASSSVNVSAFSVFVRSGGRSGHACDTGLSWSGSPTDVVIWGMVDDTSVGTAVSGSPGSRVVGGIVTGATTTLYGGI